MRTRTASIALITAVLIAGLGFASPRRVNIRWVPSVTLAQRVAAAQSLGVQNGRAEEEGTWSYEVPDVALIPGIISNRPYPYSASSFLTVRPLFVRPPRGRGRSGAASPNGRGR